MNTQDVIQQYDSFVIANYGRTPIVMDRGEGSYIWDLDGKKYLDFFPGWGCSAIGHCHPKVVSAIQTQVERLIHIDNTFYTVSQGKLAQLIAERSFGGKSFFCNSGAEANEAAIKLARRHTSAGRYKIITMEKSFHGRTFGAMSATAQSKTHAGHQPLLPGFTYVPFNDVDAVAYAIDAETAAILVEPIQGEGGIRVPDEEYLPKLRDICDENQMLLILDEVQSGCGRTGKTFAYQHTSIEPDIMTLAKALGAGAPIGAMVATEEVAASLTPGSHATTYGANPLVISAAIAMLEVIESEGLLDNAVRMGDTIREKVAELRKEFSFIEGVRGKGLMLGIELSIPGAPIVNASLDRGLRVNCTQDTILRILPAINVTADQVDEAFEILSAACGAVHSEGVTI